MWPFSTISAAIDSPKKEVPVRLPAKLRPNTRHHLSAGGVRRAQRCITRPQQDENLVNQMGCLRIHIEILYFSSRFSLESASAGADSPKLLGQYIPHKRHISNPKIVRFHNKTSHKPSCHHIGCTSYWASQSAPFSYPNKKMSRIFLDRLTREVTSKEVLFFYNHLRNRTPPPFFKKQFDKFYIWLTRNVIPSFYYDKA